VKETIYIKILYWLHLPIVVAWFGLFFVPTSIWPGKITFHFWYIVGIMFGQFLWSVIVFRKADIICPLTTWMQYLRGYKLKDKKNYNHSYIAELANKIHFPITYKGINVTLLSTLILVIIQYIWFN